MIHLKINGIPVEVPEGTTVLEAARKVNIDIPSLCYLKEVQKYGSCRMCVVEIKGRKGLIASCVQPAEEGMDVLTNTPAVRASRKTTLELILSNHKKECLSCVRSNNCELRKLCTGYGIDENRFAGEDMVFDIDDQSAYVVRDNNKCIQCMRCVTMCEKVQKVGVIGPVGRGFAKIIGSPFGKSLADSPCVGCGQCIVSCPVGALHEKSNVNAVWDAIADPDKKVVFFTAPSVKAAIGECFEMPVGTNAEGKMVAAIRRLGVDQVYNMEVTADLTIMEEATELLDRVKNGGVLPMFTSCCPGWIKFLEHYYPEMLPHLSSCKSPQQMFGAVLKSYYCKKNNIDPKNLFVVSVIPCTSKKFEVTRDEMKTEEIPDVDIALTTRELGDMIRTAGVYFTELEDEKYDSPFKIASGAGAIFGATGGVMEAALRTAAVMLDGDFKVVDFKEVRAGEEPIREIEYDIAGITVKVAVTSSLGNARILLDKIKKGEADYHFVEVMACPGGCINGGGQPILSDDVKNTKDYKAIRSKVLYDVDNSKEIRLSHENPVVTKLYDEFFVAPNSEVAHKYLHTSYVSRGKFKP